MVQGATGESQAPTTNAVHILSTLDLTEIHCTPDDHLTPGLSSDYSHDFKEGVFHPVPPGHALQVIKQLVHNTEATVSEEDIEAEPMPLTSYIVTTDNNEDHNSDKENHLQTK